jgi:uncharacterized protein (DUF885 family)
MWKRIKRITAIGAALVGIGAAAFLVPTCWGKPWSINHLGTRALVEIALESPEILTTAHALERYGLDWYSDDLSDRSLEHRQELLARIDPYLELVRSYDPDSLDPEERISRDVLEWLLVEAQTGKKFAFHDYPLNQMSGTQSSLPDFMLNMHQIDDLEGAKDYVTRVSKFDTALDQVMGVMKHQEELGVIPPRFVITRVLDEMRAFISVAPEEHVLYTHMVDKLGAIEASEDERAAVLDALRLAIDGDVYPVYRRLIEYYERLEKIATTDDGVWKLPDGEEFYAHRLRFWTTTTLTPDEIHETGLREVERIQSEMRTILEAEGYEVTSIGETLRTLSKEPRFVYPDTDEGRAQILADYQAIIDDINANLDGLFDHRPEAPVEVRRVPEFKEETAPAAYYSPPALDGSRPGVFYVNLRSVEEIPKLGMRTLAYHEAVPGHHFQIALSLENDRLPFFRRIIPLSAYGEGWALYTEQLAAEHGFQDDPYDRLGYLDAQLFRAVRLVVDTGIHAKRWTRESALRYMLDNSGLGEKDATSEVERYIVFAGQACSYMIGRIRLLELRERARDRLGERFTLPEFHDLILLGGPLPLDILEREVDRWIEETLES